jgi:putative hydrolase of the HAD superfamily
VNRAPISLPGRTVIIDYGEVISLSQSAADREAIRALAGVDGEPFWAAYHAHRDGLDQGAAGVCAYWRAIAADVGADWDDARVHELWAADFRSWLTINTGTIEVLADLKAGGTRLALLSNAGPDYGSYFRCGPLGDFFEACYVSGELNMLKPHAGIYRHVLADLGIDAAGAVFIDNREANVRGAQALGITGHVFTGAVALRAFLTGLPRPAGLSPQRAGTSGRAPPSKGLVTQPGDQKGTSECSLTFGRAAGSPR